MRLDDDVVWCWNQCRTIPNYDPNEWRYDDLGNLIRLQNYGDRQSQYGWEIDHRIPLARGGTDDRSNIRALHWQANAQKSDQ